MQLESEFDADLAGSHAIIFFFLRIPVLGGFPVIANVICYRPIVFNPRTKFSYGTEVASKDVDGSKVRFYWRNTNRVLVSSNASKPRICLFLKSEGLPVRISRVPK